MSETAIQWSELEAKRQAVLASMKRRAANRSRSTSASPLLSSTDSETPNSSTAANRSIGPTELYDAVLDLRSLGFSFEKIVELSGVRRDFLEKLYMSWNFPVPPPPVQVEVVPVVPVPVAQPTARPPNPSATSLRSQKTFYGHRVYRNTAVEKPEWLKELVIDLESSEEEDEDSDGDEVPEKEHIQTANLGHVETRTSEDGYSPHAVHANDGAEGKQIHGLESVQAVQKKRKFSNEIRFGGKTLADILTLKADLKDKIDSLSEHIEKNQQTAIAVQRRVELSSKLLKAKQERRDKLLDQVELLDQEIEKETNDLETHQDILRDFEDAKAQLAKMLIQMESLEAEQARLEEAERKRSELRQKLLNQVNKKRKAREEAEARTRAQAEAEAKVQEAKAHAEAEAKSKAEEDAQNRGTETQATNKETNIYGGTIHKIPKAQASHFTPYRSLGYSKKVIAHDDSNEMLCPLELVNGSCTDKACKFKHLTTSAS